MRYRTLGHAPAPWLVVCHGMALDHRDFLGLAGGLAGRWRVLLWDMPGHGASQPAPADWSAGRMTDALEAVLAAAGVERAVFLGFSFGGIVAQEFARRHPDRVDALIAYACFAPHLRPILAPRGLAGVAVALAYGPRRWASLKRDFARRCALTETARRHVEAAMEPLGKRGFVAMARSLLRGVERNPTFYVTVPLLLIRGADDSNGGALERAAAALAAVHPHVRRRVVPEAGHCAHLDAPTAFAAEIEAFLTAIERRQG